MKNNSYSEYLIKKVKNSVMDYQKSEKINAIEVIDLDIHKDKRGYLFESFKKKIYLKILILSRQYC